jgi:hypothetical protein
MKRVFLKISDAWTKHPRACCLITLIVIGTLLHWTVLIFHLPVFQKLNFWFWPFRPKPYGPFWLILLFLLGPALLIRKILQLRGKHFLQLCLLIVLGYGMQHGFALLERNGLDGIRVRISSGGHSEFSKIATAQPSILRVARNYEALIDSGELGLFARSKPPGQILLYMFTQRLANLVNPKATTEDRFHWFTTFASYVWPLFAFLVIVPTFNLARMWIDEEHALVACVLYLFIPSVQLITLHTDQVFYPVFFMGSVFLTTLACARQSVLLAVLAGSLVYLSLFCSFGLLPLIPMSVATCLAVIQPAPAKTKLKRLLTTGLGVAAGIVLLDVLARVLLNYQILLRYQKAIAFHTAWKGWDGSAASVAYFAFLNSLEYALWLGVPLTIFLVSSWLRSTRSIIRGRFEMKYCISAMLLVIFLGLLLFGRTKGEVARLWLFLVPLICIVAADEILVLCKSRRNLLLAFVLILQGVTIYLTKVNQDFY